MMKKILLASLLMTVCLFSYAGKPVTRVDTSLKGSEKYVLRVDERPYYILGVQVRFDKLIHRWNWDMEACDSLIKATAELGFNTLAIPIHWVEVEPVKDRFDWTILDSYISLAHKYGLHAELLWFGHNSMGHVQWLTRTQLRTPDYVMYSPQQVMRSPSDVWSSPGTTSEFTIRRDISDFTLDLDDKLMDREAYVIGKMMDHVAEWDKRNGGDHTVIGVQIENEIELFPFDRVAEYISALGKAVKKSDYPVWTRVNQTYWSFDSLFVAHQKLREEKGSYVDFVGLDYYRGNKRSEAEFFECLKTDIPVSSGNYRMMMELGAAVPNVAQAQVAALSADVATCLYEVCGPDGNGFMVADGEKRFKPRGLYVDDIGYVNQMLGSVLQDVALKSGGKSLHVFNWKGDNLNPEADANGITFQPGYINSQALSIIHSPSEIILVTSKGGTFSWDDSVQVKRILYGRMNDDNEFVMDREAHAPSFRGNTRVDVSSGEVICLTF